MLVLLPPSEGKAAPARRGRPLDLDALSFPQLTGTRAAVLDALAATSARSDALTLLGVGASLEGEVTRNTRLRELPTSPAHAVYTGVLYDALGWASLDAAARRTGNRRVLICSALWGAVRPNDRIVPYRLSMDGDLPPLGAPLARLWRNQLPGVLAGAAGRRGLVVDCRSGPYAAAAPLTRAVVGDLTTRSVQVRVFREDDGQRSVVSHLAKHTRGEVTRHLLATGADPRTPAELAEELSTVWKVELSPAAGTRPASLDVVLTG